MSRELPVPVVSERDIQSIPQSDVKALTERFGSSLFSESDVLLAEADVSLVEDLTAAGGVIDQVSQLKATAKVALIRRLLTQLKTDHIQTVLEFGLREIGDRHRRGTVSTEHNTRLLLKKDYSYQDRGLNEPNQYYVYLRRRKPKLDRYIGTLFYVPQGCALDYFLDVEGRMMFSPPHNVFQLQDCTNPAVKQLVRLLCLEPPPPDYTFDKQQNDTPAIQLHLEYLDPKTYQPIAKQVYPFPACMHEGGRLDRYRWEVAPITLLPDIEKLSEPLDRTSVATLTAESLITSSQIQSNQIHHSLPSQSALLLDGFKQTTIAAQSSRSDVEPTFNRSEPVVAQAARRVLELPAKNG